MSSIKILRCLCCMAWCLSNGSWWLLCLVTEKLLLNDVISFFPSLGCGDNILFFVGNAGSSWSTRVSCKVSAIREQITHSLSFSYPAIAFHLLLLFFFCLLAYEIMNQTELKKSTLRCNFKNSCSLLKAVFTIFLSQLYHNWFLAKACFF